VATTAETWDAETGSFTYDANGNVKTAPAPIGVFTANGSGALVSWSFNLLWEAIGTEVGIPPQLVTQAASALDVRGAVTSRRFFGLPIGARGTIRHDGRAAGSPAHQHLPLRPDDPGWPDRFSSHRLFPPHRGPA